MRWLGLILRFVFRSFSRAMGCFFACFRVRDNRHLPTTTTTVSSSRSHKPNDVAVSGNRLSTLFLSEEREDSKRDDGKNFGEGSQGDDRGLEDQAKFLKACGTLTRTPAEIRKTSEKLKVSPCGKGSGSSRFRFWLPNSSAEKVQLDVQPFNPPTPIKHCEEWGKRTDSFEHTPSSGISNAQNTDSTEGSRTGSLHTSDGTEKNTASVSPWPSATYAQRRNKSVRFECDTDLSSCDSSDYGGWLTKKTESPNNEGAYKPSPYPTPLKLSDEMQTPGTVYPATFEDLPNGMPRVQSQFVYRIDNLGENVSRSKILEEEDFNPGQDSRKLGESVELPENATSTPEKGLKKISYENESKVEESLSSWLKPASVILEERNKRMEIGCSQIRKTPADRPIIGMVAAHWNEDEDSHVPPKWWDGNGIPNSTNKYKEDQKVSWHATPFEERLEKALSEETSISQRKGVCGKPIVFDENEESDTALSQLQSSTHPQSVVSF